MISIKRRAALIKRVLYFPSAILAGICISLGCWISLSVDNPILGAVLFACGLLAVRIMRFDLFTGKTQYMVTDAYAPNYYLIMLILNIAGCFILAIITPDAIRMNAVQVAITKCKQPIFTALLKGVGCGMLMTIATHRNTPLFASVMCITAFILAGFNHCIADAYYMLATKRFAFSWFATLAGNIIGGAALGMYPVSIDKNEINV